jgi:hypothetical protein
LSQRGIRRTTATETNVAATRKHAGKEEEEEEDVSPAYELRIFRLNFILLQCIGLWISDSASRRSKALYSCFTVFVLSVLALTFTSQIVALGYYWGNLKIITHTAASLAGTVITTCDYVNLLCRKGTVLTLVRQMKTDFIAKVQPQYRQYLDATESQAIRFTLLRCVLGCFTVLTAGILPAIIHGNAADMEDRLLNITIEDVIEEKFIIGMYVPFDIRLSPQFELVYTYQVFAGTMMVLASQSVDLMLMVLMSLAAARFNILCKMLDDMSENAAISVTNCEKYKSLDSYSIQNGNPKAKSTEWRKEDVFRHYLVERIKEHQAAIQ